MTVAVRIGMVSRNDLVQGSQQEFISGLSIELKTIHLARHLFSKLAEVRVNPIPSLSLPVALL